MVDLGSDISSDSTTEGAANDGSHLSSSGLIDQHSIGISSVSWHKSVLDDLKTIIEDSDDFPCVFSKNAIKNALLKFIFVEDDSYSDFKQLATDLFEFVSLSRDWDGSLNTAYPLVISFSLTAIDAETVEEYHAFGWKVLQKLHELDPDPWPENVGKDPNSPTWSMCFAGMQLFFNMSCPAHIKRRSRNLGNHFKFIVNPRERFDVFAGNTPKGQRTRENIRARIKRYDGMTHSPVLASYEDGGIEWRQYALIEDNWKRQDRCPFHTSPRVQVNTKKPTNHSKQTVGRGVNNV